MKNKSQKIAALIPQEISILEDSRYFVNRSVEALNLQMSRLTERAFQDTDEFWDYVADSHFYIVALKRFRQALLTCKKVSRVWNEFQKMFNAFDGSISDAVQMRHVLEHIDEYIKGSGRNRTIKNENLYTIYFDKDGCLNWADFKFDRYKLHASAENVVRKYREITSREFKLYRERKGFQI